MNVLTRLGKLSVSGESASSKSDSAASKSEIAAVGPASFPPSVVVAVKALACEIPHELGLPLSRLSTSDLQREVIGRGLVAEIGQTTLWRWLSEDAIKPWSYRSWIFPRDPAFEQKAGLILDLYEGCWRGKPLSSNDFVLSTDEKTSIQCRRRKHSTKAPASRQPMRVEHEYERRGAWAYLAAWDVHRAKIFGRCERKTGILPFERLVAEVMAQEPYRNARRVFWVMDNGSSHRGQRCMERFQEKWPNTVVVHTPVHASWLNQIEIYFSVLQRKALQPNYFSSLDQVRERLMAFQHYYEEAARPFQWKFTRKDLAKLLERLAHFELKLAA